MSASWFWPDWNADPTPIFDEASCSCEHDSTAHDDGFGCTEDGCPCLAGWVFA